jgi:hypothetical protein
MRPLKRLSLPSHGEVLDLERMQGPAEPVHGLSRSRSGPLNPEAIEAAERDQNETELPTVGEKQKWPWPAEDVELARK